MPARPDTTPIHAWRYECFCHLVAHGHEVEIAADAAGLPICADSPNPYYGLRTNWALRQRIKSLGGPEVRLHG